VLADERGVGVDTRRLSRCSVGAHFALRRRQLRLRSQRGGGGDARRQHGLDAGLQRCVHEGSALLAGGGALQAALFVSRCARCGAPSRRAAPASSSSKLRMVANASCSFVGSPSEPARRGTCVSRNKQARDTFSLCCGGSRPRATAAARSSGDRVRTLDPLLQNGRHRRVRRTAGAQANAAREATGGRAAPRRETGCVRKLRNDRACGAAQTGRKSVRRCAGRSAGPQAVLASFCRYNAAKHGASARHHGDDAVHDAERALRAASRGSGARRGCHGGARRCAAARRTAHACPRLRVRPCCEAPRSHPSSLQRGRRAALRCARHVAERGKPRAALRL